MRSLLASPTTGAATALLDALSGLKESNRNLALDALLRDDARTVALLDE